MPTTPTNFRIQITTQAEAKLRNAPIDRLPVCAIREQYTKPKNKNKVYKVRGLNNVVLHCQPTETCVYIFDIDSPCQTPCNIVEHTQMKLQDASFDERRLKTASDPCDAPAGSAERVAAMAKRAAAGEQLWHELDSPAIVRPPMVKGDQVFSWREMFSVRPVTRTRAYAE